MTEKDLHAFADRMIAQGRRRGYIEGLMRANNILRLQGIDVDHPARQAVHSAIMAEPPPASSPATIDLAR